MKEIKINVKSLMETYKDMEYDLVVACLKNYSFAPQSDRLYIIGVMTDVYKEITYTEEHVKDVINKLYPYINVNKLLTSAIEVHTDITRMLVDTNKDSFNKATYTSIEGDVAAFEVG